MKTKKNVKSDSVVPKCADWISPGEKAINREGRSEKYDFRNFPAIKYTIKTVATEDKAE